MINFYHWLNEIASLNLDINSPHSSRRNASKIRVDFNKFNIIPIQLQQDTHSVFKRYSVDNNKFIQCDQLLNRRGDSVDSKTIFASNEEVANLKELANYIIKNSDNSDEINVANMTLERIHKLESELSTS
jgi:hypothetical protein